MNQDQIVKALLTAARGVLDARYTERAEPLWTRLEPGLRVTAERMVREAMEAKKGATAGKSGRRRPKKDSEPLNARVYKDPIISFGRHGPGDQERAQKEIARAVWSWLCTLPEEERNNYEIARSKMRSQIGDWTRVYSISGKFVVEYRPKGGGAYSLPARESWQKAVEQIERLARAP